MGMGERFYSMHSHGFIRAAVCVPALRVSNPQFNVAATLRLARKASDAHASIALFPELGLSAYTNDDLFHQDALLEGSLEALKQLVEESRPLECVVVVGCPLRVDGRLFNCGVVVHAGRVLGVAPKTFLPNYREYYEKRQFNSGRDALSTAVSLLGAEVPFGNDLVLAAENFPDFQMHVEVCEDVWTPVPPSTYAAMAGATVLANLSASNITIGKADYRRHLCAAQSGRCIAAYLYSAAGQGESSTDLAWDGHALIYENSDLLGEATRFAREEQVIFADVDLGRLVQDRMRSTSFHDCASDCRDRVARIRKVPFTLTLPTTPVPLMRSIPRLPYVPANTQERNQRCFEAYNIQVHALAKRLESTGLKKLVIGVSGGLDSTHAVIVSAKTMDLLGLPRKNVLAYTMPGFATSDLTLRNALRLMEALAVTSNTIDIKPSCMQMFKDISHPFARGEPVYDITFENVQAGERTSHLFRLANLHDALVVGTGDLSELALGWMTYGVGDHMSHYGVNVSVPKTMIQYLIRWVIASDQFDAQTNEVLEEIVDTEISPELVPHTAGDSSRPAQKTSDVVGPYELQDFNLYYTTRYGFRPSKVAFLAWSAWSDKNHGDWPDLIPSERRNAYDLATIKKWLQVFLRRFFQTSQFKRSCLPNGPKVGSGGSLSPRGDWRAPSDSEAEVWLNELRRNVP